MIAFSLRLAAWVVALLGAARLDWVEAGVLVPFARWQQGVACALLGAPAGAVRVDASCTGADAMALCMGAVLAFPASWRRRGAGLAAGVALLAALNAARIGTLSAAAPGSPVFEFLHLYLWPFVLVAAAALFFLAWAALAAARPAPADSLPPRWPLARLAAAVLAALLVYYALLPRLAASAAVAAATAATAAAGGWLLSALGAEAAVADGVLRTAGGAWRVTSECLLTPLLPVYLGAAWVLAGTARRRAAALLLALPLFFVLGVARLGLLALPTLGLGDPEVAVHGFRQLVAGALFVGAALVFARRGGAGALAGRALFAAAVGVAAALAAGALFGTAVTVPAALHLGHGYRDPQGALAALPAFAFGLFVAMALALPAPGRRPWRRWGVGAALLAAGVAVVALVAGEWGSHLRVPPPATAIRAAALVLPTALALWAAGLLAPRRPDRPADARYRSFWNRVGRDFPDLGGAPSTALYRADEEALLSRHLPPAPGRRWLKTDLWDEAKNSRILAWAAARGVAACGIDISLPVALAARAELGRRGLGLAAVVADVRALPFVDAAFDGCYSMGTIEHFDDSATATTEIARVLEAGGRALVGVPNRLDPFLRPVLVALLQELGLYAYGAERSYTRRGLRRLVEHSGLEVAAEDGILFVPGALRLLDLAAHAWAPPLTRATALAVAPFAALARRFPGLRRHGYLIAAAADKPVASRAG